MAVESKYNINPRMVGPGMQPDIRNFARDVDEEISFSASSESHSSSSVSTSSSSASSESSEST
jgi:hypothetical protein